jgi:hypothetical protein
MKKILPFAVLLFLFSCGNNGPSPESNAVETATLKCWNDNWYPKKGYDISKGITLLDDYLFAKGVLGKRTVEDYKKFFNDTNVVFIPDSVKGSDEMNMALNSDYSGAPNVEGLIKCWETNWFDKIKTLDSTDVLARTGKLVEKMSKMGNPQYDGVVNDFFNKMTEDEMNRPLIKDISYFIFWKTRGGRTHIQFLQTEPDAIDPLAPPPPPGPENPGKSF